MIQKFTGRKIAEKFGKGKTLEYHVRNLIYIYKIQGRVAWWLATCARQPKVPGSSPAASYVQR